MFSADLYSVKLGLIVCKSYLIDDYIYLMMFEIQSTSITYRFTSVIPSPQRYGICIAIGARTNGEYAINDMFAIFLHFQRKTMILLDMLTNVSC